MKDKIKELKELSVARSAAMEYDRCPNESEADFLNKEVFWTPIKNLEEILKKYEGKRPSDIEALVFMVIDKL